MKEEEKEEEISIKSWFVPFTTTKAICYIFLIGFIGFFNSLFNKFVFDDITFITENPQIRIPNILFSFGPNLFNSHGQYRPIPELYFSLFYFLLGNNYFFYHVIQLLMHIFVTIILFFLFKKFLKPSISLICSLIFLVHPLNVESVSFIAQTVNPIMLLFGLPIVLIPIKKLLSRKLMLILLLLMLFSLFVKETAIILIIMGFLGCYLFYKKNIYKYFLVSIVCMIMYSFFRIGIGHIYLTTRFLAPIAGLSFIERLINSPAVFLYYIKNFFFPWNLAIDQHWVVTNINSPDFYVSLILDVAFLSGIIIGGLFFGRVNNKSFKAYLFFLTWFVLGMLMHLQLFPLDQTVADRWMYIPIIGLIGILGLIFQTIYLKYRNDRIFLIFGILIVAALLTRTIIRNLDWKDEFTLYSHDIKISDNYDLENQLGSVYSKEKNYQNALMHFKRSVVMRPYEYNIFNVGTVYENKGNFKKAKKYYSKALKAETYGIFSPHTHNLSTYVRYLYLLVFIDKDGSKKEYIFKSALKDYPESSDLWQILAVSKYMDGDRKNALSAIEKAYRINPDERNTFIYNQIKNNEHFDINIDGKNIKI